MQTTEMNHGTVNAELCSQSILFNFKSRERPHAHRNNSRDETASWVQQYPVSSDIDLSLVNAVTNDWNYLRRHSVWDHHYLCPIGLVRYNGANVRQSRIQMLRLLSLESS